MKRFIPVLLLAGVVGLVGCSEMGPETSSEENGVFSTALKPGDDSIATLATDGGYTELLGALGYVDAELGTGLVTLFSTGKGQYTVFAPTNEAFTDLYALLSVVLTTPIDEITDIPAPVVRDVLFYHVVEGRRSSKSVLPKKNDKEIETLFGESFFVRNDGTIRDGLTGLRDDAAITGPDGSASNGIVHEIDQVIVPPAVVAALTAD